MFMRSAFASNKQQLDYNLMHAELIFRHRMDFDWLNKWMKTTIQIL